MSDVFREECDIPSRDVEHESAFTRKEGFARGLGSSGPCGSTYETYLFVGPIPPLVGAARAEEAILAVVHSILVIAYHMLDPESPIMTWVLITLIADAPTSQRDVCSNAWSSWAFRSRSNYLNLLPRASRRHFRSRTSDLAHKQ
jgi:hypothetical protein